MTQNTKYIITGNKPELAQVESFLNELVEDEQIVYYKEEDVDIGSIKICKTQQPITENEPLVLKKSKLGRPGEFKIGDLVECISLIPLPSIPGQNLLGLKIGNKYELTQEHDAQSAQNAVHGKLVCVDNTSTLKMLRINFAKVLEESPVVDLAEPTQIPSAGSPYTIISIETDGDIRVLGRSDRYFSHENAFGFTLRELLGIHASIIRSVRNNTTQEIFTVGETISHRFSSRPFVINSFTLNSTNGLIEIDMQDGTRTIPNIDFIQYIIKRA